MSSRQPQTDCKETWVRRVARGVEHVVGSDVHQNEGLLVFLFFINLFLLLTAYYILKVVREPLILLSGGAVSRSYARGIQAGLLAVVIPGYSILANRVEPARLVKWVLGSFVVTLPAFFLSGHAGVRLGFTFFVWLGIFSTLSIAQFWSLATDLLSEADGKRLFPLVAAGGTVGGIAGAQLAARAIRWLDPHQLMLVAAVLLASCILLTHLTHELGSRRNLDRARPETALRDMRGGFTLVLSDRYLLLVAVSVILLNLISSTGDFMLAQLVSDKAHTLNAAAGTREHYIASFYGTFETYVSGFTAVAQVFVVGRLFRSFGVGRLLFLLPMFVIGSYALSAMLPRLAMVATVKTIENSTNYSLQNTLQQALFLPTSRDAKYKAKVAIDAFLMRLGDLGSMVVVVVGGMVGLSMLGFALMNVAFGLAWIGIVGHLARRQMPLALRLPATPA